MGTTGIGEWDIYLSPHSTNVISETQRSNSGKEVITAKLVECCNVKWHKYCRLHRLLKEQFYELIILIYNILLPILQLEWNNLHRSKIDDSK